MLFEFKIKKENELYDLDEALLKGNTFKDLYHEYKNYKPYKIKCQNEQEYELLKIMMLDFYLNDLNLSLAINDDMNLYNEFKDKAKLYNKLLKEYELKYGALDYTHDINDEYNYGDNWPWDGEYV